VALGQRLQPIGIGSVKKVKFILDNQENNIDSWFKTKLDAFKA
jgi:hypothetical protein